MAKKIRSLRALSEIIACTRVSKISDLNILHRLQESILIKKGEFIVKNRRLINQYDRICDIENVIKLHISDVMKRIKAVSDENDRLKNELQKNKLKTGSKNANKTIKY